MSVRETLLRNTFWYGLVTGAGVVAGLGMSVVLARWLGPTLMGEYSYVVWAARTLDAIASLGFTMAVVRYTAAVWALAVTTAVGAEGGVLHLALAVTAGLVTFTGAVLAMRIVGAREWALLVDSTRRLVARPA